jgi:predicted nuclease of restriction endonuclease-like RecB superfamily
MQLIAAKVLAAGRRIPHEGNVSPSWAPKNGQNMKYNNKKTHRTVNNRQINFDSIAEAEYFDKLYLLQKAGQIKDLKLQPTFEIATAYKIETTATKTGKSKVGSMYYTPDFQYEKDGKTYVVEVKGFKTASYQMRKKLFLAIAYKRYGIDVFIENETKYYCDTVKDAK